MCALWGIGLLALRQGDLVGALLMLERAVDLCQDADLPVFFPWMAAALGAAYTLSGRVADAVALFTPAMAQTTAMDNIVAQAPCRLSLGEAQMVAGHLEEHTLAEQALALSRAHQERGNEAYALLLGEIAARREPPAVAQAEDHYRQALTRAAELGLRPLQAHCHRALGTLYTATGQRAQARSELSAAIDLYRTMDMPFWLPQAEATLARVEGH